MTKKKTRICDNCGQEIAGETRRINIRGNLTIYGPGIEKEIEVSEDRCLDCAKEAFEANVVAIPIETRASMDFEAK